jgi:CTP:molybdopterin cytidylyltransferase MocA
MNDVAAILLAAGRSRRMGAFKPLLPFGGRTVIESCLENLRAAGVENVVVVLGHRADEVRERLAGWPVEFAFNREPDSEMGVSLARGVERLPAGARAVLVALVDQPAVPPPAIRAVVAAWERGARLAVPMHEGRGGHPALVSLDFRDKLLNLDAARGLRGLFDAHRAEVCPVPVESPNIWRDLDTWDDYRALHEEVFGAPPLSNRAG